VETIPPSRAQILQSIKRLLEQGLPPSKSRACGRCGSALQFVDAHFQLRGTGVNGNVSLPFCPACDIEILEDLPCPETIH